MPEGRSETRAGWLRADEGGARLLKRLGTTLVELGFVPTVVWPRGDCAEGSVADVVAEAPHLGLRQGERDPERRAILPVA